VNFLACIECGRVFVSPTKARKLCSNRCRRKRNSRSTSAAIVKKYKEDPEFRDLVIAREHARRADKLGLGSRLVTLTYLGDRDGWRCGICRGKITDRKQAGIDHIIPLSRGGTHELANVQIAHRVCNSRKNNRAANDQLLIFG
jgi:5-methylcytosine-specific restriction endonuclease McrA